MADNVVPILFKVIDGATAALKNIKAETEKTAEAAEGSAFSFGELVAGFQLLQGAVGAVTSVGSALIGLNQDAENTTVVLAGVINASGMIKDFPMASAAASRMLNKIRTDSAALPGEANDYIEIIRTALPAALQTGMSLDEITTFSDKFGAVTSAMGISAGQAGSDLSRMLGGHVDEAGPSWVALNKAIGMSVKSFNALSGEKKADAIGKALAKYQPMVDAFNNTWDTASSTFVSNAKDMARVAGQPFFEMAKKELNVINSWLVTNKDLVKSITDAVGGGLVDAFNKVLSVAESIAGAVSKYGQGLGGAAQMQVGAENAGAAVSGIAAGGISGAATDVSGAAGGAAVLASIAATTLEVFIAAMVGGTAAFMPLTAGVALLAGGFTIFLGNANAVGNTLGSVANIFASLMTAVEPLSSMFWMLSGMVGDALIAIVPPIMDALAIVVEIIMGAFTLLMDVLNPVIAFFAALWKVVAGIVGVIARLVMVIVHVFMMVIRDVAGVLQGLYNTVATYVKPVFDDLMTGLDHFVNKIYEWIEWLGAQVDRASKDDAAPVPVVPVDDYSFPAALVAKVQEYAATTPVKRPASGNNYDFRGSKFDIKQDFAEGFDPDRIAVAFANDLAKLGERKMQSGFAPIFSIR